MMGKSLPAKISVYLALFVGLAAAQERPQIVRVEAVPVEVPLGPLTAFVAAPGTNFFLQHSPRTRGDMAGSVLEIDDRGQVVATYDLPTVAGKDSWGLFALDSSGNVYFFSVFGPEHRDTSLVYIFEHGGKFSKKVKLDKGFEPRQMVVSSFGSWILAGVAQETDSATGQSLQPRQVLYEFQPDGKFVREIPLTSKAGAESLRPEDPDFDVILDLSHLLADPAGNIYLVQPTERPRVFKFAPTGELLAERELPELPGTGVIRALLDNNSRLVLDRSTVRKHPTAPRPEKRFRVITILEPIALETVLEAEPGPHLGGLGAVRGDEFFFLSRSQTSGRELARGVIR